MVAPVFVDHIDIHVSWLEGPRRIFDALMPALGLSRVVSDDTCRCYYPPKGDQPFFCLIAGDEPAGGATRVAFAARNRAHVDELAQIVTRAGARALEGPQVWTEYSQTYYAIFFEDGDANKYEICYRPA